MSDVASEHLARLNEVQHNLVLTHRHVARRALARFGGRLVRWITLSDAEQQANLGLIYAARTFRRNVGVPFAGFAWQHCVGAMFRAVMREQRQYAIASAVVDCVSEQRREGNVLTDTKATASKELRQHATLAMLAMVVASAHQPSRDADEELCRLEAEKAVRKATAELAGDLQQVIHLHFFEHLDMAEVAKRLGVSYPTARRRRAMALAALKQSLRARGVADE